MVKRTDSTQDWVVFDNMRDPFNLTQNFLLPNSSGAETTGATAIDSLSNGFKLRGAGAGGNTSGGTYIYVAFAEQTFKHSRAR